MNQQKVVETKPHKVIPKISKKNIKKWSRKKPTSSKKGKKHKKFSTDDDSLEYSDLENRKYFIEYQE